MISWYRHKYILLIIVWFILGKQRPLLANQIVDFNSSPSADGLTNVILQNETLLAQRKDLCQEVNSEYQEVYSFETEEYYINICQSNSNYYYHRQSKADSDDTLLVTAKLVFGGDVFQATDNRTIYFVGKDGDRHYSSVMHNSSEIVFEPELEESILSVSNSGQQSIEPSIPVSNLQVKPKVGVDQELDGPENLTQESLICTNNSSVFHPDLNSWKKLIGQSSNIANQYALKNGHDFSYLSAASGEAMIKTKEGTPVNLNIATDNDLIKQVCIQLVADNIQLKNLI